MVADSSAAHNLADLVRRAAARAGTRLALVGADRRLTWAELDAQVDRAAAALRGLGLVEGDRVMLQLGNTPDFAVAYFATLRAGLVALPTNTGYTVPELQHLIADSGARLLLTGTVATIDAREQLAGVQLVVPGRIAPEGTLAFEDLLAAAGAPVRTDRGGADLALLIYTSGTSGQPKGAMLSHRALLANLEQCGRMSPPPVIAEDVVLLVLPLFHIYGLNPGLGMVARAAATGVLVERFDTEQTLAVMAAEGVTNVIGAPPMYGAWAGYADSGALAAGFRRVRLAISGAAPLPELTSKRLAQVGLTVHEGYGLTETAPVLTSTLVGGGARPGCVGWPIPGVQIELRDAAGDVVDDDDAGEIWVCGANLFGGYWPDGSGGPDRDGWWPTGDVAYADNDGALHLVDRRKDLVLVSGFNVYPAEVEAVLNRHPDVVESAVIGVPDEATGAAVKAYIVLRPGAALGAADVLRVAAGSLARFKLPTQVEFVDRLPHSATGKVRKAALRLSNLHPPSLHPPNLRRS